MTAMAARAIPPALLGAKPVQGALRRLRTAEARLEAARADHQEVRRQVVQELLDSGLSLAQTADLVGVSKSRVFQIARGE